MLIEGNGGYLEAGDKPSVGILVVKQHHIVTVQHLPALGAAGVIKGGTINGIARVDV